jgi:hypothetical protein
MKKIFLLIALTVIPLHAGDDVAGRAVKSVITIDDILSGAPAVTVEDLRNVLSNPKTISEIKNFLIQEVLFQDIYRGDHSDFNQDFACEPQEMSEDRDDFLKSYSSTTRKFIKYFDQPLDNIEKRSFYLKGRRLAYANKTKNILSGAREKVPGEIKQLSDEIKKVSSEIESARKKINQIARAVLLFSVHESLTDLFQNHTNETLYSYRQINQAVQNILGKTYVQTGGGKNKKLSAEDLEFLKQNNLVIQLYRKCQELLASEETAILFTCFDVEHILQREERVVDDGSAAIAKQIEQGRALPEGSTILSGGHLLESSDGEVLLFGTGKHDLAQHPCMISANIHNPYISLNYDHLMPGTYKGLKSVWLMGTTSEDILSDLYNSKLFAYKKDGPSTSGQFRAIPGTGRVIFVGTRYANSPSPQEIKTIYPINVLPYPKDTLGDHNDICIVRMGYMQIKEDRKIVDLNIMKDLTIIKSSFLEVLDQAKASKNNCYQVYGKDKGYCIVNITKELNLFFMGRYNKKVSDDPLVDALTSDYAYFAWADADTESEIFDAIDVIKFDDQKTRRAIKYKNTRIKYNNDLYAASVARHPENLKQYDAPRLLYEFMTSSDSDLSDSIEPLLFVTKPDASESETSHSSAKDKRDESGEETDAESSVSDRSSGSMGRKRILRKHRQQSGGGGGAK